MILLYTLKFHKVKVTDKGHEDRGHDTKHWPMIPRVGDSIWLPYYDWDVLSVTLNDTHTVVDGRMVTDENMPTAWIVVGSTTVQ